MMPPEIPNFPPTSIVLPVVNQAVLLSKPTFQTQSNNYDLTYNVSKPKIFKESEKLQSTINEIIKILTSQRLPKNKFSITILDVNKREIAGYQQKQPRFPASVAKMFWMVYSYSQINNGIWLESKFDKLLISMMKQSDNNAASDIIDLVTHTQSTQNVGNIYYENWLEKRNIMNKFFQQAGYEKINISQKTFPITHKKMYEPQGFDLKMRGNPKYSIKNTITTQQAARLLYEIYTGQAISPAYSKKMANLLSIEPTTRIEKKDQQDSNDFNPVHGYFSESLPIDVYVGAKGGWTSSSRQEAAYIATKDGKTAYILVVFAEDRAYALDEKIFPKIAQLVFQRMTNRR